MAIEVTEEVDEEFDTWRATQTTPPARVATRSDSGRRLDTHLLTILAVAGALPALRLPVAWLGVCGAPEWLSVVAPTVDRDAVLTCSARTPL